MQHLIIRQSCTAVHHILLPAGRGILSRRKEQTLRLCHQASSSVRLKTQDLSLLKCFKIHRSRLEASEAQPRRVSRFRQSMGNMLTSKNKVSCSTHGTSTVARLCFFKVKLYSPGPVEDQASSTDL